MTSTTEATSDNSNGILHASSTETQADKETVPEQAFPEAVTSDADEAEKEPAKKATPKSAATRTAPKKSAATRTAPKKSAAKRTAPKKSAAKKTGSDKDAQPTAKRQRRTRLFPAATFEDALELATAIYTVGAGQPVRRITLFDTLGKSPDSGASRQLVTNCAKYGDDR